MAANTKTPPSISEDNTINDFTILCQNLKKVDVIHGNTQKAPDIWRFYIVDKKVDKTIEVDTDSLGSWNRFSQQYIKVFQSPAPRSLSKGKNWDAFINWICSNGFLCEVDAEMDDQTYVANYLLEKVAGLEVTSDIEEFSTGQYLLPKTIGSKEYLVLASEHVKEHIKDTGVHVDIGVIGAVLIRMCAKGPGTPQVRIHGISTHVWPFEIVFLEKMRDEPFVWEGRT